MSIILQLLKIVKSNIRLAIIRSNHLKKNKHNSTFIGYGNVNSSIVIGKYTYGELNYIDYHDGCKLMIGAYCSLAKNVYFIMGGEHDINTISTYPFRKKIDAGIASHSKGDIKICDDVWIGYGSIILSGVTIGQGAVIGAGSVVAKDIPPYAIYAGGRIVKYRFPEEIINELIKVDFSKLTLDQVKEYSDLFYKPVDSTVIEEYNKIEKDAF